MLVNILILGVITVVSFVYGKKAMCALHTDKPGSFEGTYYVRTVAVTGLFLVPILIAILGSLGVPGLSLWLAGHSAIFFFVACALGGIYSFARGADKVCGCKDEEKNDE